MIYEVNSGYYRSFLADKYSDPSAKGKEAFDSKKGSGKIQNPSGPQSKPTSA